MPSLFTDSNFKLDNMMWYAGLHRNTKNPHMHICFFQKTGIPHSDEIPKSAIRKLKSNIANYLQDNVQYYIMKDNYLKDISGTLSFNEFAKIKSLKFFDRKFRKELNKMLWSLYEKLPEKGRLQYHSKKMIPYKNELKNIIEYVLSHDSIKYTFAEYQILLQKHQAKLTELHGNTFDNMNKKYYYSQLDKLYSLIGNEILNNFKIYSSRAQIEREKLFIKWKL